jgi:hypothetical protein
MRQQLEKLGWSILGHVLAIIIASCMLAWALPGIRH